MRWYGMKNIMPRKSNWIIQVYYPEIIVRRKPQWELYVRFDTNVRVIRKGFGFNLLGFGFGVIYEKHKWVDSLHTGEVK
jgi:hypothetical protein